MFNGCTRCKNVHFQPFCSNLFIPTFQKKSDQKTAHGDAPIDRQSGTKAYEKLSKFTIAYDFLESGNLHVQFRSHKSWLGSMKFWIVVVYITKITLERIFFKILFLNRSNAAEKYQYFARQIAVKRTSQTERYILGVCFEAV